MTTDSKNQTLGAYVKSRRESRGLTYYEAAELSDLDHTYWRKLEAGQYESPSPKALEAVANAIKAPIGDLYALAGYENTIGLPSFSPYLRSKYDLPPAAISQLESYFDFLRAQYGIPDDESVFPPKPENAKGKARKS